MRMNCFIWLWPVCAWMGITVWLYYFDITSLLFYFSSSILSHLRRVLSLTISSGRKKTFLRSKLWYRQCWKWPDKICQCSSMFESAVVISKIMIYVNLICSNHLTTAQLLLPKIYILYMNVLSWWFHPWVTATISNRKHCCKSLKVTVIVTHCRTIV